VVLTPLRENDQAAIATLSGLWSACGAEVRELDPALHDRIFAAVSHLPHLLAFGLVDLLAARPDAAELFRYAASGFRDFTRIAAGSPEMWRDISVANREALMAEVDAYRAALDRIAAMVAASDGAASRRCSRAHRPRVGNGVGASRRAAVSQPTVRARRRRWRQCRNPIAWRLARSILRRSGALKALSRFRARRASPIARCCWRRSRQATRAFPDCSMPTTSIACSMRSLLSASA
jgi:hypothetical protein